MMPFNPAEYALWLMPVALVLGLLTAFRRARRPGLIAQWAALSNGQRLTSIVIIAAFVGAIAIVGSITRNGREAILRQQFHIPDTVTLEHFGTQTKMRYTPRIEGIVRFDDAAYDAYLATLGQAAIWSNVPFHYAASGDITPAARGSGYMWYPLPLPGWAGSVTLRWGSNAMEEAQYVRNGRYFCTAVVAEDGATPEAAKRYNAKACRNVPRSVKRVAAIMLGVLDADTKTLYATIY